MHSFSEIIIIKRRMVRDFSLYISEFYERTPIEIVRCSKSKKKDFPQSNYVTNYLVVGGRRVLESQLTIIIFLNFHLYFVLVIFLDDILTFPPHYGTK